VTRRSPLGRWPAVSIPGWQPALARCPAAVTAGAGTLQSQQRRGQYNEDMSEDSPAGTGPRPRGSVHILHADLDAFFASVEQRDNPRLRGRPVVVGGLGPRGVVSTASYEARRSGVRSAMPIGRARRLCPEAVFLHPDFTRYKPASDAVFAIYREMTPLVEPVSLDEAFLDIGTRQQQVTVQQARRAAQLLRAQVRSQVGLAVSVGGGTTKLVAKIASEDAKPDGSLVVDPDQELWWLWSQPVDRIWGIGPATRRKLDVLGITLVADLAEISRADLAAHLGRAHGHQLADFAVNLDRRPVTTEHAAKSVGAEETFEEDIDDPFELQRRLLRLCTRTAERLREARLAGRTVTLKTRYGDFRTVTRSATLSQPVADQVSLYAAASALLSNIDPKNGLRLAGVSVSHLTGNIPNTFDLDSPPSSLPDANYERSAR